MNFIAETAAKYRFLTGDTEFDALLALENRPYVRYRLRGDTESLGEELERTVKALRINFPGFTSEVRHTDRVFRFPVLFEADYMFEKARPDIPGTGPILSLLYSSTTGDPGDIMYFPMNAVRWLTPPREIAALVRESGAETITADLYHFGTGSRTMGAELYLLRQGAYTVEIVDAGSGAPVHQSMVRVSGPRVRIAFDLPPQRLCTFRVRPQ